MTFKAYILRYPNKDFQENKEKKMDADRFSEIVKKEVAVKVAMCECFACYDITKSLRGWMRSDVPHQKVRDIIYSDVCEDVLGNYDYEGYEFESGTLVNIFYPLGINESEIDDYGKSIDPSVSHSCATSGPSLSSQSCNGSCDGACENKIYDLEYENAHLRNLVADLVDGLDGLRGIFA